MTMYPESGLLDANVLVYAMDADARHHHASRSLLETGVNNAGSLCVTSQILCEFYSIVTNGRRVRKPRSSRDAVEAIENLLTFLFVLPVPADAVKNWLDLLRRRPVVAADVFDLQIMAVMLANGVKRIYTYNSSDFDSFGELIVQEPPSIR